MIRDPSDGTVKEIPEVRKNPVVKESLTTPDTGLRQPTRTDAQERLEKSRSWIVEYYAKKEREHAGADGRSADATAEGGLRDDRGGADRQADR